LIDGLSKWWQRRFETVSRRNSFWVFKEVDNQLEFRDMVTEIQMQLWNMWIRLLQ
jgi:hypothetical protein